MDDTLKQSVDGQPVNPAELAAKIAKGDRTAESLLIAHYSPILMKILLRRTQQDQQRAEDAHQDTFRILIEKLREKPLDEPEKIGGFVHGIASRVLIGEFRKESRRATYADSETIERQSDDGPGPQATLEKEQTRQSVRLLINELPTQRDRQVLYQYHVMDRDKASICQSLDLTPRHFDRVISRARKRLRDLLHKNAEAVSP